MEVPAGAAPFARLSAGFVPPAGVEGGGPAGVFAGVFAGAGSGRPPALPPASAARCCGRRCPSCCRPAARSQRRGVGSSSRPCRSASFGLPENIVHQTAPPSSSSTINTSMSSNHILQACHAIVGLAILGVLAGCASSPRPAMPPTETPAPQGPASAPAPALGSAAPASRPPGRPAAARATARTSSDRMSPTRTPRTSTTC